MSNKKPKKIVSSTKKKYDCEFCCDKGCRRCDNEIALRGPYRY